MFGFDGGMLGEDVMLDLDGAMLDGDGGVGVHQSQECDDDELECEDDELECDDNSQKYKY